MSFLHNRYVKFVGLGFAALLVLAFLATIILASLSGARSTGLSDSTFAPTSVSNSLPGMPMQESAGSRTTLDESSSYAPEPDVIAYTSELERYETTDYNIGATTKEFDPLCDTLANLKADPAVHFKYLDTNLNRCSAIFFAKQESAAGVLSALRQFDGVTVDRRTESVTRHRQQLQGQTDILQQQLASVERLLATAETEFDEIMDFARTEHDADAFSAAVREKLRLIDTLTQRKISLTNRLDQLYQQSAELEERLGVVQFSVHVTRLNPIYPNETAQKWERAWEELKDTFTATLIGLTTTFGIFLLWTVRVALYLLVLIVVVRGLWKFTVFVKERW